MSGSGWPWSISGERSGEASSWGEAGISSIVWSDARSSTGCSAPLSTAISSMGVSAGGGVGSPEHAARREALRRREVRRDVEEMNGVMEALTFSREEEEGQAQRAEGRAQGFDARFVGW